MPRAGRIRAERCSSGGGRFAECGRRRQAPRKQHAGYRPLAGNGEEEQAEKLGQNSRGRCAGGAEGRDQDRIRGQVHGHGDQHLNKHDPRPAYIFDDAVNNSIVKPDFPIPVENLAWMQDQMVQLGQIPKGGDINKVISAEIGAEALKRVGK